MPWCTCAKPCTSPRPVPAWIHRTHGSTPRAKLGHIESQSGQRESGCGRIRRAAALARQLETTPGEDAYAQALSNTIREAVSSCR
jgi:hypothetical protein